MSRVKEIWDEGASIYDSIYANNLPYHRSHAAIVDLLPKARSIEVLDLGAGTGLLAGRILEAVPASRVTCLDFSANMLDVAKRRLAPWKDRVTFVCADLVSWQPERDYEAIVACNALVYKDIDLGACYGKYARHLKPAGLFLNSTVVETPDQPLLAAIAENARRPDAPPMPPEVAAFARTTGKPIAHFGPDALSFAVAVDEHLALLARAGLAPSCPWRFLSQAIVAGLKE